MVKEKMEYETGKRLERIEEILQYYHDVLEKHKMIPSEDKKEVQKDGN